MGKSCIDGRTNFYDEKRNGRPSVITQDFVQRVEKQVKDNRRLMISLLSDEFSQTPRNIRQWIPKILTSVHKNQRFVSALSFLERYSGEGDDIQSNRHRLQNMDVIRYTGSNNTSKQQSIEWQYSTAPKKVKSKQTISVWKIMRTVFSDRKRLWIFCFILTQ